MVVRSHEGREPVAPARVERAGARGRGEQATHPGGVGAPPGGQYGLPARSLADGGRHKRRPRKARPDAEGERRTARRRAPRLRKRACTSRTIAPLGAPSPLFGLEERTPQQNSGAAAPRERWRLGEAMTTIEDPIVLSTVMLKPAMTATFMRKGKTS